MAFGKANTKDYLAFPGEHRWEMWELTDASGTDSQANTAKPVVLADTLHELLSQKRTTGHSLAVALPVLQLNTVSMHLPEATRSEQVHAASLEAERLGLFEGKTSEEAVWDWRMAAGGEQDTSATTGGATTSAPRRPEFQRLVTICALARKLPEDLVVADAELFAPSFDFWSLKGNAVVLWRELGRLTAVVVRNGQAIHAQPLTDTQVTATVLQEIRCLHFHLEAAQIVPDKITLELRGEFTPEEKAELARQLAMPVECKERLAPRRPAHPLRVKPHEVTLAQAGRRRNRGRMRMMLALMAVYCIGMSAWIMWLYSLNGKSKAMAAEVELSTPRAARARNISARWESLDQVLDSRTSALRTLQAVVECLAPEGMRLTRFMQDGKKVQLEGESYSSITSAQFTLRLQALPALKGITWEADPVRPRNAMSVFAIRGTIAYAPAD